MPWEASRTRRMQELVQRIRPATRWHVGDLAWLDEKNRVGLLEPVGSAPAHRRRGLARAATLAVLHALRDAGAVSAVVRPRGDEAYPTPARLYRSLGFRPDARTVSYARSA